MRNIWWPGLVATVQEARVVQQKIHKQTHRVLRITGPVTQKLPFGKTMSVGVWTMAEIAID
jgi:hypothetical protein